MAAIKNIIMKQNSVLLSSIMLFVGVLLTDCRDDFKWGREIGGIVYEGNVVFIGDGEFPLLTEITDSRLVFSGQTEEIKRIITGSVLVLGVSDETPYGSLRKVENFQLNGGESVVSTSDAKLTDAVKDGIIRLHTRLLEKDFKLESKAEGVLINGPAKSFDGIAVTLDDFEIYNSDAKIASLDGAIGISTEIDITIKIESNVIKSIETNTSLIKIDEVTVSSNSGFTGKEELVAAAFTHTPIDSNNIVFVPVVSMFAGFDGTISSQITTGVRQYREINSGLRYENSQWSANPLIHTDIFDYVKPQTTESSDLKIFSGSVVNILLFGKSIQNIKINGYYTLNADRAVSPVWKLSAGSDGTNTINADILGLSGDYVSNIEIQSSEIVNADNK